MGHIKLWDNMLDCPKTASLSDMAFRCWIKALCCALRNGGRNGELPTLRLLVFRLRMSAQDIEASVEEMHQCGLVEPCPDNPIGGMPWRIHDWDDWQTSKDSQGALRQAKWRERQASRNALRNGVSDALRDPLRDSISIEGLKEELKTPCKSPRGDKQKFVLPDGIPADLFDDYVEMRRKNRKHMTDRAKGILAKKLLGFRAAGEDITILMELAIERCWQTVLIPDDWVQQKAKRTGTPTSAGIPLEGAALAAYQESERKRQEKIAAAIAEGERKRKESNGGTT